MAGTLKLNAVQLGDSATATNNFVWQTNVDGTAKLARGNVGATTQDVLTVDASGKVSLTQGAAVGGINGLTVTSGATTPLPGVSTTISYTHGLGVVPAGAELEIVCLTAELGYSVGDVVTPFTQAAASYLTPFSLFKTTTIVGVRTGANAAFGIVDKSTSLVTTSLTAANWSYRFKVRTS